MITTIINVPDNGVTVESQKNHFILDVPSTERISTVVNPDDTLEITSPSENIIISSIISDVVISEIIKEKDYEVTI